MIRSNFIFALILMVNFSLWSQEILIPTSHQIKNEVLFSNHSTALVGNGFFPISYSEANYHLPIKDTLHQHNWVFRKLFKEHFFQKSNENFIIALDPLLNMSIGSELLQEPKDYLFQNTRGIQAFGQLKGKISFYTAFFENQARFAPFQSDYFRNRGELYFAKGKYTPANATIPGGGRTKQFKTNGFDYASAVSYIRFTPIQQLSIQFGNLPRFFGWGYRSMLLSDNSHNYTNLSIDWKITQKLSYTFMRGKQLNLIRKKYTDFVEKPYERKGIGVHYLNYQVHPSLSIGIFESSIYLRDEAESYQSVNPIFYNPIIGINTGMNGGEINDLKNLIGLNIAWKFYPQHLIYGQFAIDDFKNFEHGFQLGYKIGNPFKIENLFLQIEYNQASNFLYAAENYRIAYTHFNLPLAHTLGNGFKELVVRVNYRWKGVFIGTSIVRYTASQQIRSKTALFNSKNNAYVKDETTVLNANFEWGYEFNAATRLQLFMNANYRTSKSEMSEDINYGIFTVGIRSALRNQYFDF